jgi:hypothetical protein
MSDALGTRRSGHALALRASRASILLSGLFVLGAASCASDPATTAGTTGLATAPEPSPSASPPAPTESPPDCATARDCVALARKYRTGKKDVPRDSSRALALFERACSLTAWATSTTSTR